MKLKQLILSLQNAICDFHFSLFDVQVQICECLLDKMIELREDLFKMIL